MLIVLAEQFQRDADEPDENDGFSEDSDIEERDINDSVGEVDGSEDKQDVNNPRRKFTYNMI